MLVAEQPTWGVDAGATLAIRAALVELARQGAAIVLISQDLDELLALCHRFAVLAGGRLSPPRPCGEVTVAEIGLLTGGAGASVAAQSAPQTGGVHAVA